MRIGTATQAGYRLLSREYDSSTDGDTESASSKGSSSRKVIRPFKVMVLAALCCIAAWAWVTIHHLSSWESQYEYTEDRRPVVRTLNGSYIGLHLDTLQQDIFLGMPYAEPPLGPLRFRHPQPLAKSWRGLRDAAAYGTQCSGYGNDRGRYEQSEDCLKINVVRPVRERGNALPVAVFIYGAGIRVGGADNQRYNMSFIVSAATEAGMPFVGVSFTYRASIGGWVISRQVRGSGVTNIGLHDQRMALRWIQENIGQFGGDPRKVTLWGGSSGARDVGFHLIAHGGRDDGLFRAAIMQSGSAVEETSFRRLSEQQLFDSLLASTNCSEAVDPLECLRYIPYAEILRSFETSPFGQERMALAFSRPSIDGNFLESYGSLSLARSRFVKVPIIIGVVTNEGSNQIPSYVRNWTDVKEYLTNDLSYPSVAVERLMELYAPICPSTHDDFDPKLDGLAISSRAEFTRIERIMGDISNNAGAKLMCKAFAVQSTCYKFRFDADVNSVYDQRIGIRHGDEIGPVFQNFDGVGWDVNPFATRDEGLLQMSRLMGRMWAGFITATDPNAGLLPSDPIWPKYNSERSRAMVFNENGSWVERDDRRNDAVEFINSIHQSVFER